MKMLDVFTLVVGTLFLCYGAITGNLVMIIFGALSAAYILLESKKNN